MNKRDIEELYTEPLRIAPKPKGGSWNIAHWKDLDFSTEDDWRKAFTIFEHRIRGRFLNHIEVIEDNTFAGFTVMALDCLLIETLQQFYDGTTRTKGTSKAAFCRFLLQSSFSEFFDRETAAKFYSFIRNGILHQAEIKGSSRVVIRDSIPLVSNAPDGKGLIINRKLFHRQLVREFECYVKRLWENDPPNNELRSRFRSKMTAIINVARRNVGWSSFSIGILAYGSLVNCRGKELDRHIIDDSREVTTPFPVEYARSSRSRLGAPTLVPVDQGGGKVRATLLIMDNNTSLKDIMDMLYRREIHKVGNMSKKYSTPDPSNKNAVRIKQILNKFGMDLVLYTSLPANISDNELTPDYLADLAIQSAKSEVGPPKKDGISYLMNAIENHIDTPLTTPYRQAILDKIGTDSLEAAWRYLAQQVSIT